MARKRMFDLAIINQDSFYDLPMDAKALYFLLGMEADDEGFVNPKKILRLYGGSEDSIKILIAKQYIIPFKSGVVVITDWKRNNYLDKNKIKQTIYLEEKECITYNEKTEKYEQINKSLTEVKPKLNQNRVEENSIEEYRVAESSIANGGCVDGLQEESGCDSCVDGNDTKKIVDFYNNNIGFLPPYRIRSTRKL